MRATTRPDLLITVTCNPKWKELKLVLEKIPKGTLPNDIPNIIVRLFYAKFKCILDDIVKSNIFGHVMAYPIEKNHVVNYVINRVINHMFNHMNNHMINHMINYMINHMILSQEKSYD